MLVLCEKGIGCYLGWAKGSVQVSVGPISQQISLACLKRVIHISEKAVNPFHISSVTFLMNVYASTVVTILRFHAASLLVIWVCSCATLWWYSWVNPKVAPSEFHILEIRRCLRCNPCRTSVESSCGVGWGGGHWPAVPAFFLFL